MEEKKQLEGMEPLNDAELKDVAAGVETNETYTYYCKHCGAICNVDLLPFMGYSIKCPNCGTLNNKEFKRVDVTTTIDGERHTVSAEF